MSIDRLAESSDVQRKSIIQIEAGRVAAKINMLHGIAHALGVSLTKIVETGLRTSTKIGSDAYAAGLKQSRRIPIPGLPAQNATSPTLGHNLIENRVRL